jgi:histidinol-phosphatase
VSSSQAVADTVTIVHADLVLALELADLADGITMSEFNTSLLEVEHKADGSPVTEVDRAVELALRARIRDARPGHAVVGEEYGREGESEWCWYLDPIDGTASFIKGKPMWGTLIGLARGWDVVVGVASMPARGHRWWAADGHGAFYDGRRLRVSNVSRLGEATVHSSERSATDCKGTDLPVTRLRRKCGRVVPADGHPLLSVAEGHADLAATEGGGAWDYAALRVIVEEAGGRLTDLQGRRQLDGGGCLASNGLLHEEALEVLNLPSRASSMASQPSAQG